MAYMTTFEFTVKREGGFDETVRERLVQALSNAARDGKPKAMTEALLRLQRFDETGYEHDIMSAVAAQAQWNIFDGCCGKWYDYANDIRAVFKSGQFDDVTLIVEGVGEQWPDAWRHKFTATDDQKVTAQIVWPEFD